MDELTKKLKEESGKLTERVLPQPYRHGLYGG